MKILLMTLNSKYIHSNLALRYLYQYAKQSIHHNLALEMKEYTINQSTGDILKDLVMNDYTHIFVSAYIWNIEHLRVLFSNYRRLNQKTAIIFGGPEVSFDAKGQMETHVFLDGVIVGEGERIFSKCLEQIREGCFLKESIPGFVFRKDGFLVDGGIAELIDPLDEIPFPYPTMEGLEHRVIYYESTRGCPYNCSYCLSATTKKVRYFSHERVFRDLDFFLKNMVPQVKFVDRTFNISKNHAIPILEYLVKNDNGLTNFHFEITADLLDDAYFEVIKKARKDLFQFEIGVQTTNEKTMRAINRPIVFEKLKQNVGRLLEIGNAHVHLDLIAGLPYENHERFLKSFDDVFRIGAHHLQLGFLKILKGTPIAKEIENHGYIISEEAPYEVLANRYIDFKALSLLKDLENALELYHNSGRFKNTLNHLLITSGKRPSTFYEDLASHLAAQPHALSGYALYELLFDFAKTQMAASIEPVRDFLKLDYYLSKNKGQKDLFAYQPDDRFNARRLEVMRNSQWIEATLPHYQGNTGKQILKTVVFLSLRYDIMSLIKDPFSEIKEEEQILLIDYANASRVHQVPKSIWEGNL